MTFLSRFCFFTSVLISGAIASYGQKLPIGSWQSYLSYHSVSGLASDGGNVLYAIGTQSFFTFNTSGSGQFETFSKVEGMSDIGMQAIGYDMPTGTAVLVYSNSNIDLFKDNSFYNVPDLKLKNIAGAKTVFEVYTFGGNAYLSSALGVIVIDLSEHTVKETFQFIANNQTIPVKSFIASGDYFYAVTTNGVYRARQDNPELQNFQVWDIIDNTTTYNSIKSVNNRLYLSSNKAVVRLDGTTTVPFYASPFFINHIDEGISKLFISEYIDTAFKAIVKGLKADGTVADSLFFSANPAQVLQRPDSSIWIADRFGGLIRWASQTELPYYTPAGPLATGITDIYAYDNDLLIAHGGYNDQYKPSGNRNGMAYYHNDKWTYYAAGIYPPFADLMDFWVVTRDETDGTIYGGSYHDGLFTLKKDGSNQLLRENSIFDNCAQFLGGREREVGGIALDREHNVWVTTMFSAHQLYAKTTDSVWHEFIIPNAPNGGPVLVDDNDQIWFASLDGGGLTVFNNNGTVADPSDDASYHLGTGVGFGNLPSNMVYCIAKDKNNNIWVGTEDGIGIVNSCHPSSTQSAPCDAELPIVQYDKYAGYLFKGNSVRSIAVDGGNRKWVGTDDGVWLLSPDASKIVYNFTADNSPLPSNHIQKISIDPVTGLVYIATDQGLVSFRGTATDGGESNANVITFPNPVPSGYTGTIAIKGLVTNGDVRITDINGQLVYRTKALGGQAVWNGLDYTGRKPQSGVYLIFVSNSDGTQTYTGKMVFLK